MHWAQWLQYQTLQGIIGSLLTCSAAHILQQVDILLCAWADSAFCSQWEVKRVVAYLVCGGYKFIR